MTRIVLFVLKSIVGVLATLGLAVVAIALIGIFAWRDVAETFGEEEMVQAGLPEAMVLELDLAPGVVERRQGGFPPSFDGGPWVMAELVQAIEAAAEDDSVDGLMVRLGAGEMNMAQVQELRAALLEFRETDKFALGFAETFGEAGDANLHYYLGTALDEIWLQPTGDLGLKGFLLEQPYAAAALEEIGIAGSFGQREQYKGAVDPLVRESMRPAVRRNLDRLMESWAGQLADAIAERRGGAVEDARGAIDQGPYLAEAAVETGLVDRLGYLDEFYAYGTRFSERVEMRRWLGEREAPDLSEAPRMALIYGLGPVTLGHDGGGGDPFAAPGLQSGRIVAALREAAEDPSVEAVVLRIDSPGGSAVASDAIWRAVRQTSEAGTPVVVSMGGLAASGGYYVAAGADRIVALPGTVTGSIGVVTGKFVAEDLWENVEINWDRVQAGRNAGYWSPNRPFTDAQWQHLQEGLDSIYSDFLTVVAEGRGMEVDAVRQVAGGRVWSGADAAERGLVDRLGGLSVAVDEAKAAAGIDPEVEVALVEYPKVPPFQRFLRDLAGLQADAASLAQLAQVVNRLEPVLRMLGAFDSAQGQGPQMRVDPALAR